MRQAGSGVIETVGARVIASRKHLDAGRLRNDCGYRRASQD